MTMSRLLKSLVVVASTLVGVARADYIVDPVPEGYAADVGTELFVLADPADGMLALELVDGDLTEFGFYFAADDPTDPANRTVIFDADDAVRDTAFVDFARGEVYDFDELTLQDAFDASFDPFGFYAVLSGFGLELFSEPLLNGGADRVGANASLDEPGVWFIAFAVPDEQGVLTPVAVELVANVQGVPVSEAGALLLVVVGVAGLGMSRSSARARR